MKSLKSGGEVGTISDHNSEVCPEMSGKYLIRGKRHAAQPIMLGDKVQIMFLLETFKYGLHLSSEFPLAQLQPPNRQLSSNSPSG